MFHGKHREPARPSVRQAPPGTGPPHRDRNTALASPDFDPVAAVLCPSEPAAGCFLPRSRTIPLPSPMGPVAGHVGRPTTCRFVRPLFFERTPVGRLHRSSRARERALSSDPARGEENRARPEARRRRTTGRNSGEGRGRDPRHVPAEADRIAARTGQDRNVETKLAAGEGRGGEPRHVPAEARRATARAGEECTVEQTPAGEGDGPGGGRRCFT